MSEGPADHWSDVPDDDGDATELDVHHDVSSHDLYAADDAAGDHAPDLWPDDTGSPDVVHVDDRDVAALTQEMVLSAFGVDPDAFELIVTRLGLPEELDSTSAAVVLGELGLDARVVHGDLDGLAHSVAAGEDVLLDGPDGGWAVVSVTADEVRLQARNGETTDVPVAVFEDAWDHAAYAMVVADTPVTTGEVVLVTGPTTVLGMSWSGQAVVAVIGEGE